MKKRLLEVVLGLVIVFPADTMEGHLGQKKRRKPKRHFVHDAEILKEANELGAFDPHLVLAMTIHESGRNRYARNDQDPDGRPTYGLLQLKLRTAQNVGFSGNVKELYNTKSNLRYGIRYLNLQYAKYKTVPAALAAYNAGQVYVCKKTGYVTKTGHVCRKGRFINDNYVQSVLAQYRTLLREASLARNG